MSSRKGVTSALPIQPSPVASVTEKQYRMSFGEHVPDLSASSHRKKLTKASYSNARPHSSPEDLTRSAGFLVVVDQCPMSNTLMDDDERRIFRLVK